MRIMWTPYISIQQLSYDESLMAPVSWMLLIEMWISESQTHLSPLTAVARVLTIQSGAIRQKQLFRNNCHNKEFRKLTD